MTADTSQPSAPTSTARTGQLIRGTRRPRIHSGHHPGATTLGHFMALGRRSKAKPRLLPLRHSGPSSYVGSALRGGPSDSSSSATPKRGEVVRTCERVGGVHCNIQVA